MDSGIKDERTAAQRRRDDPLCMGVVVGRFEEAGALQPDGSYKTYDVTVRDVCRILKCKRSFFDSCLRHHLPYVYRVTRVGSKLNYRGGDLATLLDRCSTVEQRSKRIAFEIVLSPDERRTWRRWMMRVAERQRGLEKQLEREIKELEAKVKDGKLSDAGCRFERMALEKAAIDATAALTRLARGVAELACECRGLSVARSTRRTGARWVALAGDVRDEAMRKVMRGKGNTVTSLADWGDTDEEWHRRLFCNGAARVTVAIPKRDGSLAERVLYVDDPDPDPEPTAEDGRCDIAVTLQASSWLDSDLRAAARSDGWLEPLGDLGGGSIGATEMCDALGLPVDKVEAMIRSALD